MKIYCKYDELLNPSKLKNHPKNRNKHGQDQIERLAELYKYHGIRHPIIVSNLSKCIVAGHGRKLAAIRAGIKEFPVVYQDFESSEAEYAFIQADNAIALWAELDMAGINMDMADLGPDFDINMLGLQDFTLDISDKFEDKNADEVPEEVEPNAKLGQIYQLGDHRLMCGDSTDEATVSSLMDGEKAQTFFTDPPYGDNVGGLRPKTKSERSNKAGQKGLVKRDSFIENDKDINWLKKVFDIVPEHLEEKSTKMVFFKWYKYQLIKDMAESFGEPSACCVWDRTRKASAFFRFQPQHEFCFHWGSQADKKEPSSLSNVWRVAKELENNDLHPTVKPIDLIEPIIRVTTSKSASVLDLFGGSGSTLIACEKTNRKCYMMELDPHYVDVIIARWEKFTDKKAVLLNG